MYSCIAISLVIYTNVMDNLVKCNMSLWDDVLTIFCNQDRECFTPKPLLPQHLRVCISYAILRHCEPRQQNSFNH